VRFRANAIAAVSTWLGRADMSRALVIDDEPELAGFIVAAFAYAGVEAQVAETVVEAIDMLERDGDIKAVFIRCLVPASDGSGRA
jgi:DNA-binding response OmpR family regulator